MLVSQNLKCQRRWYTLRSHTTQGQLWSSLARFNVVPAGRRSGKSELAKRKGVEKACGGQRYPNARYVFAAPTHQQAKRIFWKDLKMLVPPECLLSSRRESISDSELTIQLWNGAEILVTGLDKSERIEGPPIDWICIDEYGNVKKEAWDEHIRPALSERGGEAWLIGVPEGRNHYYVLSCKAQEQQKEQPELWSFFTWPSADILPPEEIAIARAELDELTFRQEYEASFVNFQGMIYYAFNRHVHAAESLRYDPELPLILCFDFNVAPGVCVMLQEKLHIGPNPKVAPWVTAAVDEVWIPRNSNTKLVCKRVIERYGTHKDLVYCYGDSTGGARGTAKLEGSDWEIIKACLKPVFGERLKFKVPAVNPRERIRINAMNSRLESADGTIRFLLDPIKCPHTLLDFEGVTCKEDGSGEIDKSGDPTLTHLTDAISYALAEKYPITDRSLHIEIA